MTPATRAALTARMDMPHVLQPRYFTPAEFKTLQAVCARLIPDARVDVAGPIDARLAEGKSDGWRYDTLPPDGEAFRQGLAGLGTRFADLPPTEQDEALRAAQPGNRIFEDLLAECAEVYFAHPLPQQDIGYAGFADAPGWQRIGLDEREAREPDAR